MKIHEYQAAQLFKKAGLPAGSGEVAINLNEALKIAQRQEYPVVLKVQVLVGGRGKAGGIKIVQNENELKKQYKQLRNLKIKGYSVEKIYIIHAINIVKEYYLAAIIDNAKDDVVVIVSSEGGVDIEETAKTNPKAIKKYYLRGEKKIDETRWAQFISLIFDNPTHQKEATKITQQLLDVFFANDCTLAEINPLVIDDQENFRALDAKINIDDNALYRQKHIAQMRDLQYEDPDELEAKTSNLSFVKLDGNVGCMVNGAGLAMATMDIIKLVGGNPANFLDVGGSSNPKKVLNALTIILRNNAIKVILINIFGGITRCDDIANGILKARKQIDIPVPLVIRLTGTNEKEAKKILEKNNITTYSTMREAVEKVANLVKN